MCLKMHRNLVALRLVRRFLPVDARFLLGVEEAPLLFCADRFGV